MGRRGVTAVLSFGPWACLALAAGLASTSLAGPSLRRRIVATVQDRTGTAEVRCRGSEGWSPAEPSQVLRLGCRLRTGSEGWIRVEFANRVEERGSGPTSLNLGADTEVRLQSFHLDPLGRRSEVDITLYRGVARLFSRGWGSRSHFALTAGTTVCGIRGSQTAVRYQGEQADEAPGLLEQICYSGSCFSANRHGSRPLDPLHLRRLPSPDPESWEERRLSEADVAEWTRLTSPGP